MILLTSQGDDWVDGNDEGDAYDDLVDDAVSVDAMQEEDTDYARPIQPRHRKYCPMHVKRPLLMCPSQQKLIMQLASWVENGREADPVILEDKLGICSHCDYVRDARALIEQGMYRTIRLFTLCQGFPIIKVEDRICPQFHKLVYFTKSAHALFPSSHKTAYASELLYIWL